MPPKEEIIEDAETLFHLVVPFPPDELDSGAPLAKDEEEDEDEEEEGAEVEAGDQVGPGRPKRKSSARTPSLISEARKRPRQGPRSEIPVFELQSGDVCGISNVILHGTGYAHDGPPPSDLPQMKLLRCQSTTDDTIDGTQNTLPPETTSERDHKEILKKIAGKLKKVADDFDKEVRGRGASSNSSISVSVALEAVEKLVSDLTYDNFQDAVIAASGEDHGLQQLVCVFRLASAVTNKARTTNALASVNAFYTRYFTNNLADWVDSVGGWGGVLELLP